MPTSTIEEAITALRRLPLERQQELAPYIYKLAADEREPEAIDAGDLKAVTEGLEQAKRRQFASPRARRGHPWLGPKMKLHFTDSRSRPLDGDTRCRHSRST